MSIFSGRCDLLDHIAGMGGWYDENGKPVKFGDPDVGAYYSDEYRDFLAFKKQTGGVIHQHKVMKVNPWNYEEVTKLTNGNFQAIPHVERIPDKRVKGGFREKTEYTYEYCGKKYSSLKELNKHKVYVTIDITFNTLLDLIPYYPYIVVMSCGSTVYISQDSYVDEELDDHLDNGWYSNFWQYYKKKLQDHYREVVLTYFNPIGREVVEEVIFDDCGVGEVSNPIDENFDLEWRWEDGKKHSHWTSPKIKDAEKGLIQMSKEDLNNYIGKKALVYYVKYKNHPININ